MKRLVQYVPSPATVLAVIALIAAVAGTSLAASSAPAGNQAKRHRTKTALALTKAQANSLIASYLAGHHIVSGSRGAAGPAGATGPAGPSTGPAGGDLAGTYPNPTIAPGKVTSADFAMGAQAPDAAALAGNAPSDYGAVLSGRIDSLSTAFGTSDYGSVSGISTANGMLGALSTLSPNHTLTARDLTVALTHAPGPNAGRRFLLVINGSGVGAVGCLMTGPATTCNSGSATSTIPAGSTLELTEITGFPGASMAPAASDALVALRLSP